MRFKSGQSFSLFFNYPRNNNFQKKLLIFNPKIAYGKCFVVVDYNFISLSFLP